MDNLILEIYSNGDLYMMFAKIFSYLIAMSVTSVVIGTIRGLKF